MEINTPSNWKIRRRVLNALLVVRDAWPFWLMISVLAFCHWVPKFWTTDHETAVRHTSILLQMAGLVLVGYGLEETRRSFNLQPVWEAIQAWFAKLWDAVRLPPRTASGNLTLKLGVEATGLVGTAMPRVRGSTEERLSALETDLRHVRADLARTVVDREQAEKELRRLVAEEVATLQRENAEVRSLVREQVAGSLHLEVIGLIWVVWGTVLGW
jgi:hypothetical protein